ncbi:MAG: hypothetical protein RIN56_07105 [Sporomusaceae bacterium]|nr:hypothetical protein [Sporomusaceae bacterium]
MDLKIKGTAPGWRFKGVRIKKAGRQSEGQRQGAVFFQAGTPG